MTSACVSGLLHLVEQETVSPIDGSVYARRELMDDEELLDVVRRARAAQVELASVGLDRRREALLAFADALEADIAKVSSELAWQMGRPKHQAAGELRTAADRARVLVELSEQALCRIDPPEKAGFERWIERRPVGVVLVLAPWNYPYLTAVNAVVAALLAGNAVVLKHSDQTPLVGEHIARAVSATGLPEFSLQHVVASHDATGRLLGEGLVDHVSFTGSVEGGDAVARAAGLGRISSGLELGGKDAAYVCADANLEQAIEGTVDGAYYNSGQSCCAVERIYVEAPLYAPFVEGFVQSVRGYRLGSPLDESTTLGPMVRTRSADAVRRQINDALSAGARALLEPEACGGDQPGTPYLQPQVLVDVPPDQAVMTEESFGPVVCISSVSDDAAAVREINRSRYGLTASLWSSDTERAKRLGSQLDVGTVFLNRCDFLDPYLAWTGVKDSGRGCTLSVLGFDAFVRPQSFHFRLPNR